MLILGGGVIVQSRRDPRPSQAQPEYPTVMCAATTKILKTNTRRHLCLGRLILMIKLDRILMNDIVVMGTNINLLGLPFVT